MISAAGWLRWTYPHRRVGRPGVMREIRELTVRMAEENPNWGYARIQGALRHLNHRVARSTIARVMKEHGIKPAPDRPMSWATFVRSHAHDSLFSPRFKEMLGRSGVEILMTACQAPNLNAHTEQFVGSIRAECLDQVIFVGCASLERTIAEYVARDHGGRSHQGPENEIPSGAPVQRQGDIEVSGRLGGLLNYYHPQAA